MAGQRGLFDLDERYAALSRTGDPLERLAAAVVDFEVFRAELGAALARSDRSKGGRPPMDAVGYGDLQPELNRLSKEGRWEQLGSHIDDAFLHAFATRGRPEEIAGKLRQKYGAHADRLAIYAPYAAPDAMWSSIIAELKAG